MRFSEHWLRAWVDPPLSSEALAERLTMAGLELEALETVAPDFSGVVVAEVLALEPHPNADRLRVCQVADGGQTPRQVVCGARNVRVGMKVPLARPGARLPGDKRIEAAALRGVPSAGMLCSARELGLASEAEGLLELAPDALPGTDLRDALGLDDRVFELNVTPNRGDCLSVLGVAREVAALCGLPLAGEGANSPQPALVEDRFAVTLEPEAGCLRYVGRVARGVDAAAPTPEWMRRRLERSGLRSLNVVVDITNYVMLELGQPMHAFDLDRLRGGIEVRGARAGEQLELLDATRLELEPGSLVIADAAGPLALAGIMGGRQSGVTAATTSVFLESAFFDPVTIALRARSLRLATDSSHRFERGVDPALQRRACERASELLVALCGAKLGPAEETGPGLPPPGAIALPRERIARLLGCAFDDAEVLARLEALGAAVEPVPGGWSVTPPSWRFDLRITVDLIEELARLRGYDQIPATSPGGRLRVRREAGQAAPADRARRRLSERGYNEAITFSFVDAAWQQALSPGQTALALRNPIASDLGVMRTDLWAGLLRVLAHNQNRQQERVRLFEVGRVFVPGPDGLLQSLRVGGLAWGALHGEGWGLARRPVDFFDLKADVEALLALAGAGPARFERAEHPALHPGQSARIELRGEAVGWLGALNPVTAGELGLPEGVWLFELALAALESRGAAAFAPVSRFPAVRRDLSLLLAREVPAARVLELAAQSAGGLLQNLELFDVYEGERIDPLKKSLALRLTFQAASSTLVDEDVEAAVQAVTTALHTHLGALLRE